MTELIKQWQVALDEVIDVLGRATIEAVLRLLAEQIAGHRSRGRPAVQWAGTGERRTVCLRERKLRVIKPRLRQKGKRRDGEARVPAY